MAPYRTLVRWGFVDGRARKSMMFRVFWEQPRHVFVYAVAWALGHLFLEKEAS